MIAPLGGTTTQDSAPAATPDAEPSGTPDASLPTPTPPGAGPAETCAGAPLLAELSVPMELPAGGLTHVTFTPFGASNDDNPLQGAGLPPACSLVYDARGRDVIYAVHLEPGQTLVTRTVIEPDGLPAGIYLLEDCETGRWPVPCRPQKRRNPLIPQGVSWAHGGAGNGI